MEEGRESPRDFLPSAGVEARWGEEGRERESQFHASFLPSLLSLLLRPAARGIREDVTFILRQFPIPSLPPSIYFAVFIDGRGRGSGSFWEAHSPLSALRQKKKRFPYQIPSSAFALSGYYRNGLRARERTGGKKEGLEWRAAERRGPSSLPNLFIF